MIGLRSCLLLVGVCTGSSFRSGRQFSQGVLSEQAGYSETQLLYRQMHLQTSDRVGMVQRRRATRGMRHNDSKNKLALSLDSRNDDDGPDPSLLICSRDDATQRSAFVLSFAALAIGTKICILLWYGPGLALLGSDNFAGIRETVFPIVFGSIFAIVGVLHFVFVDNFARIVPPVGTWGGLWQAPAPFREKLGVSYEEYHSYWTGVVEFVGGLWLLASGLDFDTPTETPAFLLFLLTIAVTPANLYMFTHDATPGGAVPRLAYPAGHAARFILQCGLLSNFWIMANSP
jgi:uncharacterized membrane protein